MENWYVSLGANVDVSHVTIRRGAWMTFRAICGLRFPSVRETCFSKKRCFCRYFLLVGFCMMHYTPFMVSIEVWCDVKQLRSKVTCLEFAIFRKYQFYIVFFNHFWPPGRASWARLDGVETDNSQWWCDNGTLKNTKTKSAYKTNRFLRFSIQVQKITFLGPFRFCTVLGP